MVKRKETITFTVYIPHYRNNRAKIELQLIKRKKEKRKRRNSIISASNSYQFISPTISRKDRRIVGQQRIAQVHVSFPSESEEEKEF